MGAWARAGWRVWDLGNGTIMLEKLFNPEWQITSKSFLLSSVLIGFSFSPTAEISRLELEFEESLPRQTASKRGLDRSQMEQPIKKSKFSYFASFVHKRSGNEIRDECQPTGSPCYTWRALTQKSKALQVVSCSRIPRSIFRIYAWVCKAGYRLQSRDIFLDSFYSNIDTGGFVARQSH